MRFALSLIAALMLTACQMNGFKDNNNDNNHKGGDTATGTDIGGENWEFGPKLATKTLAKRLKIHEYSTSSMYKETFKS